MLPQQGLKGSLKFVGTPNHLCQQFFIKNFNKSVFSKQHLALEWPQKNLGSRQRNRNSANKIIQKKFTRLFETETNISRNYQQLALVPEEYDNLNIFTEAIL